MRHPDGFLQITQRVLDHDPVLLAAEQEAYRRLAVVMAQGSSAADR